MAQTAESVLKDLEAKKFAPLYFLQGDEPYFIDSITEFIEQNALTEAERSFNQSVVYGKDVTMNQVLESARRFPMMAMRQVLIVKEAQGIQDIGRKAAQEQLITYAQNPVPSTVLVFAFKNKSLDGRSQLKKTLEKHAVFVDSKKLYDNKVPSWIKQHCKLKGFNIKDRAVGLLADHIGNDLARIANELDKMMLNYEDGSVEITETMISKHVGISREYNVFELQSALGKKEVFKANQILNYFEANPKNNPVIPIISMLFSYFSKVMLVHQNRSLPKNELARLLGVNPYFVSEYMLASQNYPLNTTLNIIKYLHQADLQSKGVESVASESQLLKELVFKIMHA
ncbi:DNA polymerase III subunit delta [Limibacter armeniacum]|uniref:DNA polymerase III subunit delta n=1 Tax=Limibacter armeniacum TaxID=466084 RepID=UPI002FE57910